MECGGLTVCDDNFDTITKGYCYSSLWSDAPIPKYKHTIVIKDTTDTDRSVLYLDLHLKIDKLFCILENI
jgi:hypothetical protein